MDSMTPDQRRAHLILHGQTLLDTWVARCKLYAAGDKLRAEGAKLWAEGDKPYAEGHKLCAEGDKLRAEGNKLYVEGHQLWAEAVRQEFGAITMEWVDQDCHLSNGEVYIWIA